ncbi:hypothetical protein LINPERPRIM_LOCUS8593 [Linum perenne]
MAWELGARKVILQLDSLIVVIALEGRPVQDSRHSPITTQIHQLRNRNWQTNVIHVFREAN